MPIPGSYEDRRAKIVHKRPQSGLVGFAAAWAKLEHVSNDTYRNLLAELTRTSGFQGAPALTYMAVQLRWLAGVGDYAPPAKGLKPAEVHMIEARARELLAPYRAKFPKNARINSVANG